MVPDTGKSKEEDDERELLIPVESIVGIVVISLFLLFFCFIGWCVCVFFGTGTLYTYSRFFGYNIKNTQASFIGKKLLAFPTAVNKYVKGGDLLFMEDLQYFDDYT